mmetsp:Transcript_104076/g.333672  ORF Transcript_104076/g.333672 Transcript_104076/m.333672 type:complete len:299 (+) Transcript_104076:1935-2831(+)
MRCWYCAFVAPHSRSLCTNSRISSSLTVTFCPKIWSSCSSRCCALLEVRLSRNSPRIVSSALWPPRPSSESSGLDSSIPSTHDVRRLGRSSIDSPRALSTLECDCMASQSSVRNSSFWSASTFNSAHFSSKISSSFWRSSLASRTSSSSCLVLRRYKVSSVSRRFISSKYFRIRSVESRRISDRVLSRPSPSPCERLSFAKLLSSARSKDSRRPLPGNSSPPPDSLPTGCRLMSCCPNESPCTRSGAKSPRIRRAVCSASQMADSACRPTRALPSAEALPPATPGACQIAGRWWQTDP